jgi:hypothetical protein
MLVPDGTRVAVLGRGRWATTVHGMLVASGVEVAQIGAVRQAPDEDTDVYVARIATALRAAGCTDAWLCVPPGRHVPALVRAAVQEGVRVVAEKPWPYPPAGLGGTPLARAEESPSVVVCFEYVLLDAVQEWRTSWHGGAGLTFHGAFTVAAPDRLGIPALWNLGSHLVAIREWAVPQASLGTLKAAYDSEPERRVWLEDDAGDQVAEIDFRGSNEPILQRFVAGAAAGRAPVVELDLTFAERVRQILTRLEPWQWESVGSPVQERENA